MLAGVYGVMNKQSEVSKLLSFTLANYEASRLSSAELDKTTPRLAPDSNSTSNTLDDSHWIEDPLFEKAAGPDLVTESETPEMGITQPKAAQETIKQASPKQGTEEPVIESVPEIKQLLLELNPEDTTIRKKIPVTSV
jgi:hypothetical protein